MVLTKTQMQREASFRGVPHVSATGRSPAFIKHRAASRAIATRSHFSPGALSYPEFSVSSPPQLSRGRPATAVETTLASTWPRRGGGGAAGSFSKVAADLVMASDTGMMQGTRRQKWALVSKPKYETEVLQPNWPSSDKSFAFGETPRASPIKKYHTNSSKRELEIYGNRPVSPTRGRPARVAQYKLYSRPSKDGSFGEDYNQRVYSSWATGGGGRRVAEHTAGPGNKFSGVSMAGRIDTVLSVY